MRNIKIHFSQNLNPDDAVKFEESAIISDMSSRTSINVVLDSKYTIEEISRLVYHVVEKLSISEDDRYNCAFQDIVWGESIERDDNSRQIVLEVTYYLSKFGD